MMLADNTPKGGKTPDIVAFLVLDSTGHRIACAAGPLFKGNTAAQPGN